MRARLIRQQDHAAGVEIEVVRVQVALVVRREVVEHRPARRIELEERVAVVDAAGVGVERAVAGGEVEVAGRIDRRGRRRSARCRRPRRSACELNAITCCSVVAL